jgi:hypothetical protein
MLGLKNAVDEIANELNDVVYNGSAGAFPYLIGYVNADEQALYINERLEQAKYADGTPFFWKPNVDAFAFIGNGSAKYTTDPAQRSIKINLQVDLIATYKGGSPIRLLDCLERFFSRCNKATMVSATIDPTSVLLGEFGDNASGIKAALTLTRSFIDKGTAIVKVTLNVEGFANSAPITKTCPCVICKKC